MKHIHTLCEAADRLEAELKREHTSARVKAALAVLRSRVDAARYWMEQTGEVQRSLFDDSTPSEPIIRAPYSDRGNSLDAAAGTIQSGAAKRQIAMVLRLLETAQHKQHPGATCDQVEERFEARARHRGEEARSWHSALSARLNDLEGRGLAVRDGSRKTRAGRRAGVYHITKAGEEALSKERATK